METSMAVLHGRFAPALNLREERRLKPRDPRKITALKALSMRTITEARRLLSKKYQSFNHVLPRPLLEEMMVSPETRLLRTDAEGLRLLLTPGSRSCSIHVRRWRPLILEPMWIRASAWRHDLDDMANLVLNTAKDGIRTLEVGELGVPLDKNRYFDPGQSTLLRDFLHRLLRGLSDLQELSVVNCPDVVTDETFEILTKRHKNLKKLTMRGTSEGISCMGLFHFTVHCSQLKELDITDMNFHQLIYINLMPLVPNLETLTTSRPIYVGCALMEYAMRNPRPLPLQLNTKVTFIPEEKKNRKKKKDRRDALQLFSAIPNVTDVTVSSIDEEMCIGITETSNEFETFKLEFAKPVTVGTQRLLMEKLAPTVTTLKVDSMGNWDVGLIAQHCLGLNHLEVRAKMTDVGEDFEVMEEQFANLVTCTMYHHSDSSQENLTLPNDLLIQLFSSPRLRDMFLGHVNMSSQVVTELCEQASRQERGVLSSLASLRMDNMRGLSATDVIALMCAAPRLTKMVLCQSALPQNELAEIQQFQQKFLSDLQYEYIA